MGGNQCSGKSKSISDWKIYKIYYAKIWAEITWKGFNVDWKNVPG